ncbi:MAG: bifunctional (p)ppGpp synthetase/guanosine-3',5'-bis(diphosphate) 3'-pyrophosphohydrolase [Eubacteriales bacterium]|jgi:GTP pyrophosphokinase|nr:bifunctional (p)ppGpp synthetase/guanosine-3',5'-bis(diphosphate) 3'-pyrophosphohydrolase [Eubacteriales bacterium]MDD4681774.1 bifunctional (p)ppGpp synthetase/guanosine-3',5'-bis(diphosphate) 3'-pyrophosphohydrolase [Eubacteriales bacterium]
MTQANEMLDNASESEHIRETDAIEAGEACVADPNSYGEGPVTQDEIVDDLDLDETEPVLQRLIDTYEEYSGASDSHLIREAFNFARQAHQTQRRATGEPYIIHPLATAEILLELEVDCDTLVAALLHDTVEDTGITVEEISERFGEDVAMLVDGVTKLSRIPYSSKEEIQAENFRKMFLAMARDIRVVLIKLADRLHNMRTIKHMRPEKQLEKARETLDIYAPLAHRLGIYKVKWELEDLCLRYIDREVYYELVGSISQKRSEREHYLEDIIVQLRNKIAEMGIKSDIEGRPKHFYSIYHKMKTQGKSLDQIYDLFATRIIVDTVADCYAVLGLVHELYKPMPGRFKDYIAMPKPNMYQSLHTTVIGPKGIPFEVQIRTFAMHRTAEYGIAAHWRYKEGDSSTSSSASSRNEPFEGKLNWLRQLLEWQKDMRDAGEFMESLKSGLVADEVFVFTPKGDVKSLPAGSVPIDFAYNIHSGIGNKMYGAKVNGRIVPLTYELKNGDIIEILTSDKVHGPSRDWLKIVKSASARTKISQWFKKEMREENVIRGKEIVEREIRKTGFQPAQLLRQELLDIVLKRYNFNSLEDIYAAIGYGGLSAGKIVPRLRDEHIRSLPEDERIKLGYRINSNGQLIYSPASTVGEDEQTLPRTAKPRQSNKYDHGIVVKGIDNCLVKLSRCCSPVPGDPIIGYVTRGKGVAVHRTDCTNIRHLLEAAAGSGADAEKASRLIDVAWSQEDTNTTYQVELKILARDRRHLLGDISNAIAEEKVSILSGQLTAMKDVTATLLMSVEVNSQQQYDRLLGRIKAVKDVIEVRRGH